MTPKSKFFTSFGRIGCALRKKLLTEIFNSIRLNYSYHQKYRLQQHPWLCKAVGLQSGTDFKRSHLAARLNGYVYGQGNLKGFNEEVEKLGLNENVADFVRTLIIKNEGQGLTC